MGIQRYFIEVAYKGTAYCGFQIQDTGKTIQSAITEALQTIFRIPFELTGSSRTDAGVHAAQNFFHVDSTVEISTQHIYNLNAVLPKDIVIKQIFPVSPTAHCRFDAISRTYQYTITQSKAPFLIETAWLYPYKLNLHALNEGASMVLAHADFTSFSKRNTQVKTFICQIQHSKWVERDGLLVYEVTSNRFLRGMIRGLVATMLKLGSGSITPTNFQSILDVKDCSKADFSAPAHGLCLMEVAFPS
jgi:tRNA pseudouridine38-40 synthase